MMSMRKIRHIFVFSLMIAAFSGALALAGENNDPAQGHCTDVSNIGQANAPKSDAANPGNSTPPKPVNAGQIPNG